MSLSVARFSPALLPGWRVGLWWTGCMAAYSWIDTVRSETTSSWEWSEHLVVWLMGLGVIGLMRVQAARQMKERDALSARLVAIDQRWRAAVESTGDGLWDWDGETNTCFYSSTWKAMIGYRDDEFPGTHEAWVAQIHPDDRARVRESVEDNMAGRTAVHACEYRLRCKDGSYRWVLGRGRVIARAPDGRPLRAVGTHTDITERRTAAEQARQAHEWHRFFLEHAADPMVAYRLGANGRPSPFIEVNAAACRLSGYSREELLRKSPRDLERALPPQKAAQRWRDFRSQRRLQFETEFIAADGRAVPVEFHAEWREFAGHPLVLATARDIRERRAAEERQRRADAEVRKLARAVEQSPAAVVITDTSGVIEYANPQFCRVTGYTLEEVRGQNPRVLKSGQQDAAIYRELWSALRAGREWRGELCNRRKDGTLFWEDASISPIVDEAGHTTHFLAVKEDITARREALARIREQAALIDATRDAFIVVDLAGVVRFWNRGAQELYGWTAAEATGRKLDELTQSAGQRATDEAWRAILGQGEWRGELTHHTKAGGRVISRVHGLVLRGLEGAAGSVLVTASDITEAKQLEAKFLRAQRLESVGALASGVAHDLNNVLSPIMMSLELLRPLAVTEPDREVLRLMSDSARRGADVVRQLLLFGRGAEAPSETMELGKVVKEILRMVRETLPRSIAITSQCPRDLWPIRGHATELYQVLLNFCVNARDAMPQGGRLAIDALNQHVDGVFARQNPGAHAGRYVVLKVTDTGAGIAPEILDRIFDPFFTTKEQGQGTGLGLATVLGIAKSHGGFVTVTSRVGEGSEFRVYLPASAGDGSAAERAPAGPAWRGRGELVLVVDDEPAIRQVLGRTLAENGYRVLTAATGAEALPLCAKHRATLAIVILDMMMPGLDGPQVLKLMREAAPELPVVACSGQHGYAATLEKLGLAQVEFVPKPVEIPPLMEKVRILIDARTDRARVPAEPHALTS